MNVDLDSIERDIAVFAAAKESATPGEWYQGAWYGVRPDHIDPNGPETESASDEVIYRLVTDGEYSRFVSSRDHALLIGADEDGPILSEADARFIVVAKNIQIESHTRRLLDEVRRLMSAIRGGQ
jgi:hypothetical protein